MFDWESVGQRRSLLAAEPSVSYDQCTGHTMKEQLIKRNKRSRPDEPALTDYLVNLSKMMSDWKFPTSSVALHNCREVHESYRELGICHGYRSTDLTFWECLDTLAPWNINNETVNVWSHILATVLFAWRFMLVSYDVDHFRDPYTWPLFFYMITSCLYPLMSAAAHAFSALSVRAHEICYFLDYTALAIYSFGSAILYRAYVIPDNLMGSCLADVFLYLAVVNSVGCTAISCYSRFVADGPWQKFLRLGSFALPFFWDTAPLLCRLLPCWLGLADAEPCSYGSAAFYHTAQLVSAHFAGFIYASHLPERIWPGQFDFIGNSHNWLHVFGVVATIFQSKGAFIDVPTRRATLIENGWNLSGFWSGTTAMIVVILSLNLLTVTAFSLYVMSQPADPPAKGTKTKDK